MRDCADIDPRLAGVRMPGQRRTILRALLRACPEAVPHAGIQASAQATPATVKQQIFYLRQALALVNAPLVIETDWWHGYRAVWAR